MTVYQLKNLNAQIDPSVFIAPSAAIIGDVCIGGNSSIWFSSVIRGDADRISIGNESNIQDLSMLHADPGKPLNIGDQVTIGHRSIIHGCMIDSHCLIGMGAIIMNGAQIGEGCIIAAGSVILEETVIPPYSMVAGLPGKVKKTFEKNIIEIIDLSAKVYVERAEAYKSPESFSAKT